MKSATLSVRLVNLGCGTRFHPDWVNIDIAAHSPAVIAHNLRRGIPLRDTNCDAVYHSNIIEHFRREDALPFLRECWRVLKPGGVLRVATPDLERICELYLQKLRALQSDTRLNEPDYDWMLLEMFDQTVREKSGGAMRDFLRQNPLPNEPFIFQRIGQEGRELVKTLRNSSPPRSHSRLKQVVRRPRLLFECLGEQILKLFWGGDAPLALCIGRFRLAGEVHHWLYDRYSLARLMTAAGFCCPTSRSAAESGIPAWQSYHLDTLSDGVVIKPDSFFMEASKPS